MLSQKREKIINKMINRIQVILFEEYLRNEQIKKILIWKKELTEINKNVKMVSS